jgi:selenophosphate synthetase-related protein
MVLVTPEPDEVLAAAEAQGFRAQAIGKVTDGPGIQIRNRGADQSEKWLKF